MRRLAKGAGIVGLGILVTTIVAITALMGLLSFGLATNQFRALPVMSDSMTPTFSRGDVIIVERQTTFDLERGDIVVTYAPNSTTPIAHRIVSISNGPPTIIQTKGDANTSVDAWNLKLNDTITWRVTHRIPSAGKLIWFARSTVAQVTVAIIVVPAFLYMMLGSVWRNVKVPVQDWRHRRRLRHIHRRVWYAICVAVVLLITGPTAAAWNSAQNTSATYTTSSIQNSYPTNLSCSWATGTTTTLGWTASGDSSLDGYDPMYATTSGGSYTSLTAVSGYTSTGTTAFTPTSPVGTYFVVKGKRGTWRSNASTEIPVVSCPRYLNAYAGKGTIGFSGDSAAGTSAQLNGASGIAVDSSGNVYIADTFNNRIRKMDTSGNITTIAGNGTFGFADGSATSTAQFKAPTGVAVDSSGNVYIADAGNNRIRKLASGSVSTIAGTGTSGFADGSATSTAQFANPTGVAVDASGNVYVADAGNNRIRELISTTVSTIAGTGTSGFADGSATSTAQFATPYGVALDGSANVYVADMGNNRIRKLASGSVSTIAGTGTSGSTGDTGTATSALLNSPRALTVDSAGNVYVADTGNNRIRVISPNGKIYLLAGSSAGNTGDAGLGSSATLDTPRGVGVNSTTGDVYIGDTENNRVRALQRSSSAVNWATNIFSSTPSGTANDGSPIEVGTQFSVDYTISVTGMRFYKNVANTGTHTGKIWDLGGNVVASLTFSGETASGWQTTNFGSPVNLQAGTYIMSYFSPTGQFDSTTGAFPATSGIVHVPTYGGRYIYNASSAFPSNTTSSFYGVDLQYSPTPTSGRSLFTYPDAQDPNSDSALTLGVRIRSDVAGTITGVRYYRQPGATNSHTVSLWNASTYASIATKTVSGETGYGWQYVAFTTPVSIAAGTDYVASTFFSDGKYNGAAHGFDSQVDRSPLHGPAGTGTNYTGNCVYVYGASNAFPYQTYQNTNYFIDVKFTPNN